MAKDKRRAELEKFLAQCSELPGPSSTPAEHTIWLVLARHGSKEGADRALRAIWRRYVDVNEFRVAKSSEVATIIGRSVRGDAVRVSEEARGFLRRFHKDQHTIDFGATEVMTVEQLRKYLASLPDSGKELALGLFLHYCSRARELETEDAEATAAEGKPKKRGSKDLAQLVDRLRLAAAVAAKGEVVAKVREAQAARGLVAAWAPGSAPEAPPMEPPEPPPRVGIPTPPVTHDAPSGPPARGGKGAPRPHRTRGAKARRENKGSSRR